MKKYILFFVVSVLCFPLRALGANLFFESSKQYFAAQENFTVDLHVNTEGQDVNAFEGTIAFPSSLLLKKVHLDKSIMSFWVTPPTALAGTTEVPFSGIIPGGYKDTRGNIFSLEFQARTPAEGDVLVKNFRLLRNDGVGSDIVSTSTPFHFVISPDIVIPPEVAKPFDTSPPENFRPEVFQSPDIFDGATMVAFSSQDKISGIDHYELAEKRPIFLSFGNLQVPVWQGIQNWKVVESPYRLEDQKRQSTIYVKAVDHEGNERIVEIAPLNSFSIHAYIILMFAFFFAILCVSFYFIHQKHKHKSL